MFSVCMCVRFQANPKESHLTNIKRILRYLISTQQLGLWHPNDSSNCLIGYSNANFIGSGTNRKRTS